MSVNTGWKSPTATHASQYVYNPNNGWADDGVYVAYYQTDPGYARYDGFTFEIPAGSTIVGIEVKVNHKEAADSDNWASSSYVSNNHGSTWSTGVAHTEPTTVDSDSTVGSSSSLWGKTWSASTIDTVFVVSHATTGAASNPGTYSLDAVSVQITYELGGGASVKASIVTQDIAKASSSKANLQIGVTTWQRSSTKADIKNTYTKNNSVKLNIKSTISAACSPKADIKSIITQSDTAKTNVITTYYCGCAYDWKLSSDPTAKNRGYQGG